MDTRYIKSKATGAFITGTVLRLKRTALPTEKSIRLSLTHQESCSPAKAKQITQFRRHVEANELAVPIVVERILYRTISEACEHHEINYGTVLGRLERLSPGYTAADINECFVGRHMGGTPVVVEGYWYPSIKEAAMEYGIRVTTAVNRLARLPDNPEPGQLDECFLDSNRKHWGRQVKVEGIQYVSISAAAHAYGIKPNAAAQRLHKLPKNPTVEQVDACFTKASWRGKTIEVIGKTYDTIMQAATAHGYEYGTIMSRLRALKEFTPEAIDACFTTPLKNHALPITMRGIRFPNQKSAALHFGIDKETLRRRLASLPDMPTQEQIDDCAGPVITHTRNPEQIYVKGKYFPSVTAAAKHFGISQSTADQRLKKLGESPSQRQINAAFNKTPAKPPKKVQKKHPSNQSTKTPVSRTPLSQLESEWDQQWEERYQDLIEFKKQHGHCKPPRRKEAFKTLCFWVNRQRQRRRNGKMTKEHMQKLDAIGFHWG